MGGVASAERAGQIRRALAAVQDDLGDRPAARGHLFDLDMGAMPAQVLGYVAAGAFAEPLAAGRIDDSAVTEVAATRKLMASETARRASGLAFQPIMIRSPIVSPVQPLGTISNGTPLASRIFSADMSSGRPLGAGWPMTSRSECSELMIAASAVLPRSIGRNSAEDAVLVAKRLKPLADFGRGAFARVVDPPLVGHDAGDGLLAARVGHRRVRGHALVTPHGRRRDARSNASRSAAARAARRSPEGLASRKTVIVFGSTGMSFHPVCGDLCG